MTLSAPSFKRARPALGTTLELKVSPAETSSLFSERAELALTQAFGLAGRLERVFNYFDTQSELSAINRFAAGEWIAISPELAEVMKLGVRVEKASKGAFRLMPACEHGLAACYELSADRARRLSSCVFDLGGIAKGYIVDQVFKFLVSALPGSSLSVNAGGDLRVSQKQTVELRVPSRQQGEQVFRIEVPMAAAMATSSLLGAHLTTGVAAAKYQGTGASDIATATVFADSCAVADALTKVALFSGSHQTFEREFGVRLMAFDESGKPL